MILAALVAALLSTSAASAQGATNTATAWGNNQSGELGDGTSEGPEKCSPEQRACSTRPVGVSELSGVSSVSAGEQHSLALLEQGTVMAWGNNLDGQLGDGSTTSSDVPVAVSGLSEGKALAAAASHSLALLGNGTVVAWGENSSGQLGDGTTTKSDVPVAVTGLSGVTAIAAGGDHSLALLEDGTVMAWGDNSRGDLGDGSTTPSDTPVAVSGLSGVTAIAAGGSHSLALLSTGTVMAWGNNKFGQLGDGGETNSDVPVAVSKLSQVKAISAGQAFSLALMSNGVVMAWGENDWGQLGDGSRTGPETCGTEPPFPCSKTPVAVKALSGVSSIAAGSEHALARLSTGSVLAWGSNNLGQLGDGNSTGPEPCSFGTCSTVPVAVSTQGAVAGIAAGGQHSLAFGPAPPAPTNLPEFGHCVKVEARKEGKITVYSGAYGSANCVALSATHEGKYEWKPGPGAAPKFSGVSVSSTAFETVGKAKITCGAAELEGEYAGAKTASVSVKFTGCKDRRARSCQSAMFGTEGEIQSPTAAEAELGFITGGEKPVVGLDLKPKSPSTNLWTFECGKTPETDMVHGLIEGSVIATIKGIDVASEGFTLTYKQKNGIQSPERFEGGLKDTLLFTTTQGAKKGEKSEEQAALGAVATLKNQEALEIKAKA